MAGYERKVERKERCSFVMQEKKFATRTQSKQRVDIWRRCLKVESPRESRGSDGHSQSPIDPHAKAPTNRGSRVPRPDSTADDGRRQAVRRLQEILHYSAKHQPEPPPKAVPAASTTSSPPVLLSVPLHAFRLPLRSLLAPQCCPPRHGRIRLLLSWADEDGVCLLGLVLVSCGGSMDTEDAVRR